MTEKQHTLNWVAVCALQAMQDTGGDIIVADLESLESRVHNIASAMSLLWHEGLIEPTYRDVQGARKITAYHITSAGKDMLARVDAKS